MRGEIRRKVRGPRSDGARETDRYLRERGISVPVFCAENAINWPTLRALMAGESHRASVDICLAVQAATAGRVTAEMWRESTVRDDIPGETDVAPAAVASGTSVAAAVSLPPTGTK
jgi:hypothetical protein